MLKLLMVLTIKQSSNIYRLLYSYHIKRYSDLSKTHYIDCYMYPILEGLYKVAFLPLIKVAATLMSNNFQGSSSKNRKNFLSFLKIVKFLDYALINI